MVYFLNKYEILTVSAWHLMGNKGGAFHNLQYNNNLRQRGSPSWEEQEKKRSYHAPDNLLKYGDLGRFFSQTNIG